MLSPRRTRSRTAILTTSEQLCAVAKDADAKDDPKLTEEHLVTEPHRSHFPEISPLPSDLKSAHTKLSKRDQAILRRKQDWLRAYSIAIPKQFQRYEQSVDATLVFAQEEAGTAVCISPGGILLTCSHCVAENEKDLDRTKSHWLLFRSGDVVAAKCVAWDGKRDLALLQVVAAQSESVKSVMPHAVVAMTAPEVDSRIICVGHPGSEDLEASQPGIKTNYDVLHVSTGWYRGCAEDQDVQDNSEIGALQHDAWTYWGHSGAPLFCWKTGQIVGLHSSWDDQTAMRRGVALEAIRQFLEENVSLVSSA